MKKINLLTIMVLAVLTSMKVSAQVKIGSNPTTIDDGSILEIESTTRGFVPPRMTTAQMNAIPSPLVGSIVFNTDINCLFQFKDTFGWSSLCESGSATSWTDASPVTFTALTAARVATTAPTVDPNAFMNLREWKICDDGYVEETIVVASNGTGGAAGGGYYIITPQFNIDTSRHVVYTGNLNVSIAASSNTYAASVGSGTVSQDGANATLYAVPISTNQLALASLQGSAGDRFINSTHYQMSVNHWQLKLTLKYKPAP
ncbi:hypothetical protein L3X37_13850 [Sabulilitoribacter arenilitoris]|uniref:Uncharacterized protein n=1 Tax=Wocania arenilitoris TaxID=2044858 RepID=A0AAE3ER72_9FLAO|nr:hypothetical protein [Wocania arenilitoris]MCF7569433.1 hypothetical protein [Wocania arenilitoris]